MNRMQNDDRGGDERPCDHDGCAATGAYRAPRSVSNLRDYYWFCMEHVREYNLAWNYYAGMSDSEVEMERRRDTFWHRPTWPLRGQGHGPLNGGPVHDPFETGFGSSGWAGRQRGEDTEAPQAGDQGEEPIPWTAANRAALAVLDLRPPVTAQTVKKRYKELVKRHHPDANGGDTAAEEILKAINQAYAHLKTAAQEHN